MSKLVIDNLEVALQYPAMLSDCMHKAKQYTDTVTLYPRHQTETGWLEWGMCIGENRFFLAAIKRMSTMKTEFCS